jgi:hypothetical protein
MVILESIGTNIVTGYAQYNHGEKAAFSEEEAAALLFQFPEGWRRCQREDAAVKKAYAFPVQDKMYRKPERKK